MYTYERALRTRSPINRFSVETAKPYNYKISVLLRLPDHIVPLVSATDRPLVFEKVERYGTTS